MFPLSISPLPKGEGVVYMLNHTAPLPLGEGEKKYVFFLRIGG